VKHQDPATIEGEPVVIGSLDDAEQLRSFTSWKLDLINCMSIDPRLKPSDVRLAIILLRHLNSLNGQCNPSEATLAQQMKASLRTVENCKSSLESAGWLSWRRTQKSNWYEFHDTHVSVMLDYLLSMQEANREKQLETQTRKQLRIGNDDTRNKLRISNRNPLRVSNRSQLRTNTSSEHHKGTPEDSEGIEKRGMDRGVYVPPSFDHLDGKEDSR
jgi:hypothetical protein